MTSCICGTPDEDGGVGSVTGTDVFAVGSLEVVCEVVPVTWVSINGASFLTGGNRVGLKAYGF